MSWGPFYTTYNSKKYRTWNPAHHHCGPWNDVIPTNSANPTDRSCQIHDNDYGNIRGYNPMLYNNEADSSFVHRARTLGSLAKAYAMWFQAKPYLLSNKYMSQLPSNAPKKKRQRDNQKPKKPKKSYESEWLREHSAWESQWKARPFKGLKYIDESKHQGYHPQDDMMQLVPRDNMDVEKVVFHMHPKRNHSTYISRNGKDEKVRRKPLWPKKHQTRPTRKPLKPSKKPLRPPHKKSKKNWRK